LKVGPTEGKNAAQQSRKDSDFMLRGKYLFWFMDSENWLPERAALAAGMGALLLRRNIVAPGLSQHTS
jgi:hypothetical protein